MATLNRLVTAQNVEAYGKVRRLNDGDTMCASRLVSSAEDRRDATWIRVSYMHAINHSVTQRDIILSTRGLLTSLPTSETDALSTSHALFLQNCGTFSSSIYLRMLDFD